MTLLRLISWPYVRRHALRTALTAVGVMLGTAVFVGMHTANDRVVAAFSDTISRIAGKTELQISSGESGFGEEVLETVQSVPAVRVAVPVIEAVVRPRLASEGDLLVLGVDMTGDRSLRDYQFEGNEDAMLEDPLVFLAQPDSLIVSKELADKHQLKVGGRLTLETLNGDRAFTVRGIMTPKGLATAFGGNLAVMDVYAAQYMFGRGRTFDRIDVAIAEGNTVAGAQHQIAAALGAGFDVQPPTTRGQQAEAMVAGYRTVVNLSSAFALFIGMFIVHSSFLTAVTQRRHEIGILRALGATRRQVRNLFLAESVAIGAIGSLMGVAIGAVAAQAITVAFSQLAAELYGVAQQTPQAATDVRIMVVAGVVGVLTSTIAAVLPARRAARTVPLETLQHASGVPASQSAFTRLGIAAVLIAASVGLVSLGERRPFAYAGYFVSIVAALVGAPVLGTLLTRMLRPLLKAWRPVEGGLAGDSLLQVPERTAGAILALTFSVALAIAFAGMARSAYGSVTQWLDTTMNSDLFVLPSQRTDLRAIRFPAAMSEELSAIPGIERVQPFRSSRTTFRGKPVMLAAIDMASVQHTVRQEPVAGARDRMYVEAAAGRGVLVSDNLAQRHGLSLGDQITLPAPHGTLQLPIVGVLSDYTDQQGTVFIDRSVYSGLWRDDTANDFRIFVKPGSDAAEVRRRIIEHYAGNRHLFVMTNAEARRSVLGTADQWFRLVNVQIAVAVVIAILGIVNALTVSITDRRREFGVLKAVGALRGQIRQTIWLEAASVATVGLTLGTLFGALMLRYLLEVVQRDAAGLRLDYRFPVATLAILIPIIVAAALIAAIWPAEVAVRGSLTEALEYE